MVVFWSLFISQVLWHLFLGTVLAVDGTGSRLVSTAEKTVQLGGTENVQLHVGYLGGMIWAIMGCQGTQ